MKTLQNILLATVLTAIAFPVAAQEGTALKNKITRSVVKAAEKAKPVTCALCGKEMDPNDPSRRCDGDPDVHCVPEYHYPATQTARPQEQTARQPGVIPACPKCHEPYTIDEMYHGSTHVCASESTEPTREVKHEVPAQPVQDDQPARATCPKCHEPYTCDEIYHGTSHECEPQAPAHVGVCGYCGQPVTQEQAETIAYRHDPYNYRAEEIMSNNQGRVIYGPDAEREQTFECPYCSQDMHQLKPATKCGVCHKPLKDGEHVHHCQPAKAATK